MTTFKMRTRVYAECTHFDSLVDAIHNTSGESRALFIVPKADKIAAIAAISHARASTLFNDVLIHVSSLSPLGISTLCEMLVAASEQLSSAQLIDLAERLDEDIRCFAFLKSVARVQVSTTSVFHHLLSWLPPTRFVAEANGPVVMKKRAFGDSEFFDDYAGDVLVKPQQLSDEGQHIIATVTTRVDPSNTLVRSLVSADYWGTNPIAEWCVAPSDLGTYMEEIRLESQLCPWCHEPFVPPQCATCSASSMIGERV